MNATERLAKKLFEVWCDQPPKTEVKWQRAHGYARAAWLAVGAHVQKLLEKKTKRKAK